MPHFLECSVPSIRYLRGEARENHAINIDLCKKIRKVQVRWYPDNQGKPAIAFDGCDAEWAFDTENERDAEYARIIGFNP